MYKYTQFLADLTYNSAFQILRDNSSDYKSKAQAKHKTVLPIAGSCNR
jgi:hypothetical protein